MARYKRLINFTFFLIFFVFNFQNLRGTEFINFSCVNSKKEIRSIESTNKEIYCLVPMQESDESYTACKKMVLFFMLSKEEFDSLCEDKQWDISDAFSDFSVYAHVLIKFLDEHNISHDWTTKRKIIFLYENGEKEEIKFEKEIFRAWILFDGVKRPKIFTIGGLSDEMISEVEKYFGIK